MGFPIPVGGITSPGHRGSCHRVSVLLCDRGASACCPTTVSHNCSKPAAAMPESWELSQWPNSVSWKGSQARFLTTPQRGPTSTAATSGMPAAMEPTNRGCQHSCQHEANVRCYWITSSKKPLTSTYICIFYSKAKYCLISPLYTVPCPCLTPSRQPLSFHP